MTLPEMPELPEPAGEMVGSHLLTDGRVEFFGYFAESFHTEEKQHVFTADQMRAYGEACARVERERAALLCERMAKEWIASGRSVSWEFRAHGAEECAAAIRGLPANLPQNPATTEGG